MKKKFLGLAVAAIAVVSFSASAQTECTPQCTNDRNNTECRRQPKKNACVNPFEGMNLTDAQQAQLRQLNENRRNQCRQARTDKKQKCDSARTACRRAYLDQVKAIVGPEQYVVFLENVYVNTPRAKAHHGKRGDRNKGKRHNCNNAGSCQTGAPAK